MSSAIRGVLLAAGSSQRFGGNKLLHPLSDGTPVALAAAEKLVQVLPDALAVVRDEDDEIARLLVLAGLELVVNRHAEAGMGGSISCAVEHSPSSRGWIFALADMPWVETASIACVVDRLEAGDAMAAPLYREQRGHPVGFSQRYQAELLALDGDRGARQVLARYPQSLTLIEVDDPGVILDIDTHSDLDADINVRRPV